MLDFCTYSYHSLRWLAAYIIFSERNVQCLQKIKLFCFFYSPKLLYTIRFVTKINNDLELIYDLDDYYAELNQEPCLYFYVILFLSFVFRVFDCKDYVKSYLHPRPFIFYSRISFQQYQLDGNGYIGSKAVHLEISAFLLQNK